MNPAIYILLFLMWILVLGSQKRGKEAYIRQILKMRKGRGQNPMQELVKNFIGKRCIIQTFNSQADGVIKEVSGGGLLLEAHSGGTEAINLDFIVCVKEYPKNRKGKDKAFSLD